MWPLFTMWQFVAHPPLSPASLHHPFTWLNNRNNPCMYKPRCKPVFMNVILFSMEYTLFISSVPISLLNFSATLGNDRSSIGPVLSTLGFGDLDNRGSHCFILFTPGSHQLASLRWRCTNTSIHIFLLCFSSHFIPSLLLLIEVGWRKKSHFLLFPSNISWK